jgi:hypothetical protein
MLDVNEHVVLRCGCKKCLVVFEQFDSWLCDEHVDATLNCVLCDWIVGSIRRENRDCSELARLVLLCRRCPYSRCLSVGRQLRPCTHLGRSCPPLGTRRTTHLVHCTPRRCSSVDARLHIMSLLGQSRGILNSRIAGNLPPETPTMDSFPTFPRLRRSNSVSPTTPTFLSDLDAPPPTNPVVYSPVPTWT